MCESGEFDSRVLDSLKNFDLNSAEVKQQFGKLRLASYCFLSDYQWNKSLLFDL